MLPIPSNKKLSLFNIADHWAREIVHRCTPLEVLIELSKAWWRGQLASDNGPKRVRVLQALHACYSDRIVFYVTGTAEKPGERELPDGSVEISLWCVPLPNFEPGTWTDTNCASAFEALALAWDPELYDLAPLVGGVLLSQSEFSRWIDEHRDWQRPVFWADEQSSSSPDRKLTKSSAAQLAYEYIQTQKDAGRTPTQDGFINWVHDRKLNGPRDILREAFKTVARVKRIPVMPGRPRKNKLRQDCN
jgi:hypothetical protein